MISAQTKWASPIALVPKKDGTFSICVAYRPLSASTILDSYAMPRTDDYIESLSDIEIATALESSMGILASTNQR